MEDNKISVDVWRILEEPIPYDRDSNKIFSEKLKSLQSQIVVSWQIPEDVLFKNSDRDISGRLLPFPPSLDTPSPKGTGILEQR